MNETNDQAAAEVIGVLAFELNHTLAELHLASGDVGAATSAGEAITDAVIEAAGDAGLAVASGMVKASKADMSRTVASVASEATPPNAMTMVEGIGVLTLEICRRLASLRLVRGDTEAVAAVSRTVPVAVLNAAGTLRPVLADLMEQRLRDEAAKLEKAGRSP